MTDALKKSVRLAAEHTYDDKYWLLNILNVVSSNAIALMCQCVVKISKRVNMK